MQLIYCAITTKDVQLLLFNGVYFAAFGHFLNFELTESC